jgi:hypothetical protein
MDNMGIVILEQSNVNEVKDRTNAVGENRQRPVRLKLMHGDENARVYAIIDIGVEVGRLEIYKNRIILGRLVDELGIEIYPEYRRYGYAESAIKQAVKEYRESVGPILVGAKRGITKKYNKQLWSVVLDTNKASIYLHSKLYRQGRVNEVCNWTYPGQYGASEPCKCYRLV